MIKKIKDLLLEDYYWEKVTNYKLKYPEFERPSTREQMKARDLMKRTKEGAFDRPIYEGLEPETQKFFRYLLMLEIKSARYEIEQLDEVEMASWLDNHKSERKRAAINCRKFLEMIK